jgi:excisionase family DNA binding protein
VLYGWAEIAKYLRRSLATVQRWHKDRRMPIAFIGYTLVIPRSALDLWILGGRQTQKRPDVEPKRAAGVISFPTP